MKNREGPKFGPKTNISALYLNNVQIQPKFRSQTNVSSISKMLQDPKPIQAIFSLSECLILLLPFLLKFYPSFTIDRFSSPFLCRSRMQLSSFPLFMADSIKKKDKRFLSLGLLSEEVGFKKFKQLFTSLNSAQIQLEKSLFVPINTHFCTCLGEKFFPPPQHLQSFFLSLFSPLISIETLFQACSSSSLFEHKPLDRSTPVHCPAVGYSSFSQNAMCSLEKNGSVQL